MGSLAGTGVMASNSRAPNAPSSGSRTYQPTYTNYSSPAYRAVRGASMGASNILSGLGGTPQAQMYSRFTPQMPTYSRPTAQRMPVQPTGGLFSNRAQPAYSIPMPVATTLRPTVDPNLAAINQAFAPQRAMYDSDGNTYTPTRYMEQSQRDAILQNPGTYLNYARYLQAGNDPSTYRFGYQTPQMMTQAQRNSLTNSQRAELSSMLPAAPDSGGGD